MENDRTAWMINIAGFCLLVPHHRPCTHPLRSSPPTAHVDFERAADSKGRGDNGCTCTAHVKILMDDEHSRSGSDG